MIINVICFLSFNIAVRFKEKDTLQHHSSWARTMLECNLDISSLIDDKIAEELGAGLQGRSEAGLVWTFLKMPIELLSRILHTQKHIHDLMELVILYDAGGQEFRYCILFLTHLLRHYLNRSFLTNNARNPEIIAKLRIIASHPQITKMIPHLEQDKTRSLYCDFFVGNSFRIPRSDFPRFDAENIRSHEEC